MKISISQLSKLTGKDRRTITRLLASLTPEKEGRSHLYESKEALLLIYAGITEDGEHLDLTQERAALARAQRQLADIKIQESGLELVSRQKVAEHLCYFGQMEKQLLRGLPTKMAPLLVGIDEPATIFRLLTDEMKHALYFLHEGNRDQTPYEEFRRA